MMLLQTLIVAMILWVAYILPAIIAIARNHPDRIAILALNILLGWTVLGWVICLVWGLRRTAAPPISTRA